MAAFVNKSKIAAKSIGVAYLEPSKRLVITLGYVDDTEPYPVKLHCIPLGKVDVKAGDFHALEASMAMRRPPIRRISSASGSAAFSRWPPSAS